jgi:acetylornithine deacetylase/succinyl-diaminopimelate desuccinylase-like protein
MTHTPTDTSAEITRYLTDHLRQSIQEIVTLCAQPSISASGEGVLECAQVVLRLLEQHGFTPQLHQGYGNPIISAYLPGRSDRTLLFYNHYDVQPVEPLELWTNPPFEPTERDGKIFARGVSDDKGEFIARLAALEAVKAAHGGSGRTRPALPCGVFFVLEGEEEVGSPHIARFVQDHLTELASHGRSSTTGAVWEGGGIDPDGHPGTSLGYRGILYVSLSVELMNRDAHSGGAHALPNAAWRLHRALATLKDEHEKILIPGFYEAVIPPSAADLALYDALPDREAWLRQQLGIKTFVNDLHGKDLMKAVFNPTCNIDGLTAGYQGAGMKTVIPAKATAKVDFRLVPDQSPDDIFAKLRLHFDRQGFEDVKIERLGGMFPYKASPDDPLVALTVRTGEAVYGKQARLDPLGGGSSPAYAFAKPLGISVVDAGIGYWDGRAHAPDENIRIEDFLNGARHLALILDGFAEI